MRIAVVFFSINQKRLLQSIAKSITAGIEGQGYHPDIIDGNIDRGKKLTMYQYVVIVAESFGFMGKVPDCIPHFLKDAGNLIGKHSSTFVLKSALGSEKSLLRLMKVMEAEGMYLKYSDMLKNEEEAILTGKKLHIDDK